MTHDGAGCTTWHALSLQKMTLRGSWGTLDWELLLYALCVQQDVDAQGVTRLGQPKLANNSRKQGADAIGPAQASEQQLSQKKTREQQSY